MITTNRDYKAPGCQVVGSVEEALKLLDPKDAEVFVIGGARVFKEAFDYADRVYLTEIKADFEGDTFFPKLEATVWQTVSREAHAPDENQYHYEFYTQPDIIHTLVMENDTTPTPADEQADDQVQADGYYGDDDAETEELDLSFLDEEDEDSSKDPK